MSTVELPKIIEKSNANMKWFFSNHEWSLGDDGSASAASAASDESASAEVVG